MSSYKSQESKAVATADMPASALPGVPSVKHRQRGWRERSLWRYLMAAVVLTVLHLPFLFVKIEKAREPVPKAEELADVISLPLPAGDFSPDHPEDGLAELYGWLKLANPSQWYFPDDCIGFSAANRPVSRPVEPPFPAFALPQYVLSKTVFPEWRLRAPSVSVPETSAALWYPLVEEEARDPVALASMPPPMCAQTWRLADGSVLAEAPQLDDEGLKAWQEPANREVVDACFKAEGLLAGGDGCTWLEVTFDEVPRALLSASASERRIRMPLPRIAVCHSCGAPALDAAAQRALRRYLRGAYAGDRLPPPGRVLLCVSW